MLNNQINKICIKITEYHILSVSLRNKNNQIKTNVMKREYDNEVKCLSCDIIKDKCNAKEPNHQVFICNFNNMIVDKFDCYLDKKLLKK